MDELDRLAAPPSSLPVTQTRLNFGMQVLLRLQLRLQL